MFVLAGFAFLSGIITILSPCILPVLPVILAGGTAGGKARPIGVILGFILSFTIFTVALSAIADAVGVGTGALRIVAVVVLATFGMVMLVPRFSEIFERAASRLTVRFQPKQGVTHGFFGGVPVGMSLGILWTPCVGPILASVISLALASSIDAGAFIITFAYSLGTAIPMVLIMFGGRALIERVPALTNHRIGIRRGFGGLMILVAVAISVGWDVQFQTAVLQALPQYGRNLTAIEQSQVVSQALREREGELVTETTTYAESGIFTGVDTDVSRQGVAGMYGQAPDIVASGPWINSDPLTMEELRGKVVLLDFWTYSCINCIRTLPYLRSWHEKYRDTGLVILGVHSPEFAFERSLSNVQRAVKDLDVRWPVVLDNSFAQWRSYKNRFWPAHFLIDHTGEVRFFTFGEGAYRETEMMIQSLLIEAGFSPPTTVGIEKDQRYAGTGEIYLGRRRAENYVGDPALDIGRAEYRAVANVPLHHWTLNGRWLVQPEYAQADETGAQLTLRYEARSIYAVVAPPEEGGGTLHIRSGGEKKEVTVDSSRMYRLDQFSSEGTHEITLTLPEGMKIYTFTFGG